MPYLVERRSPGIRVPLSALFMGFLKVSFCGFGGGFVWARRQSALDTGSRRSSRRARPSLMPGRGVEPRTGGRTR
jgi:hypothetical protein